MMPMVTTCVREKIEAVDAASGLKFPVESGIALEQQLKKEEDELRKNKSYVQARKTSQDKTATELQDK
ncbi:hypothetical protein DY000_02049430 [Brassica cretica]|uniref:Uncharacterized protein n=1 Tax=Brassica cretica TaxID=69181 RepID=A0ABQ7F8B5_BRACR|nr:hypothetical protein DY000_02049430 [Brassica cretica]